MPHAGVRLVAFDLDGTLTRGDTVCEAIARRIGRLERMQEFERLTPLSDPHAVRAEMASWYRAHPRQELLAALEDIRLAPGAEEGIRRLHAAGVVTAIVSITWLFAVEWFAQRLGVPQCAATGLSEDGAIEHFLAPDKPRWALALSARLGIAPDQVAAVGDSPGDIPLLQAVGHPFFVGQRLPAALGSVAHRLQADIAALAEEILALGRDDECGRMRRSASMVPGGAQTWSDRPIRSLRRPARVCAPAPAGALGRHPPGCRPLVRRDLGAPPPAHRRKPPPLCPPERLVYPGVTQYGGGAAWRSGPPPTSGRSSGPWPAYRRTLGTARVTVCLVHFVAAAHLGKVLVGDPGFWLARSPDTLRAPDGVPEP